MGQLLSYTTDGASTVVPRAGALATALPTHTDDINVLWVDDVRINRILGQRIVQRLGYHCDIAADGEDVRLRVATRVVVFCCSHR